MVYENGKIYTIRSYETDKYYIGSTCNPLRKRFFQHKVNYGLFLKEKYHYVSSFDIMKYDDCYIELLEMYPCTSKEELNKHEGECIRKYKNEVVNKQITGRTNKEYREDNKEGISKQRKQYRDDNKIQIREKKQQKFNCPCGVEFTHGHKARHERTIVHHRWLESQGEQ
jgi:hypothetical protein